jgi:hypothetical protein
MKVTPLVIGSHTPVDCRRNRRLKVATWSEEQGVEDGADSSHVDVGQWNIAPSTIGGPTQADGAGLRICRYEMFLRTDESSGGR